MRTDLKISKWVGLIKLFIGLFILVPELAAQDAGFTASAPTVVSVGKAFNYTVSGESQGEVSIKNIEGIRILSGPSQMVSYQSSNVNGRLTTVMQVSYTFMMVAEKEGEYVIPPAVVKAGKKELQTNEVKITVVPGAAQAQDQSRQGGTTKPTGPDLVILRIIPSKTELYEGEQLVLSTKIMVRTRIENPSLNAPSFEGFWVQGLDADQTAKNETYEGYSYNTQIVKRELLTAQRKGEIQIQPATLDVVILNRIQRRRSAFDDFFNDPFFSDPFDRYEREPRVIKSNGLKINIKSLPSGAPSGFNGAVGNFNVSAHLKNDSIQTNNAISLVFEIRGRGNLNLVNPPKVDFPPDLEVFEPKRSENINHSMNGTEGKVSFEYVIIPRHNGNYRISPMHFSWFDPSHGNYQAYESPEFRFTAFGGEESREDGTGVQTGFFRSDVRNLDSDIRFIKLSPGKLSPKSMFLLTNPLIYGIYAGGIILLLLAIILRRRKLSREADIFYVRNKKAGKIARKRLKNALVHLQKENDGLFEEILKAFWGYLSDRLAIHNADISREKITEELKKRSIDDETMSALWNIIEECEFSRYSPQNNTERKALYDQSVECLAKLEQKL